MVEITLLRKLCHAIPRLEWAARLGRSRGAVNRKIGTLGLTHPRKIFIPTPRQLEFIRRNAGELSFVEIVRKFGTNPETIRKIAVKFGFRARPTSRPWLVKDDARLRRLYGTMKRKEIAERMNRIWEAVAVRARQLGITREIIYKSEPRQWTAREDERLRSMAGTMTKPEIARRFRRSMTSVVGRMAALGLRKPRATGRRSWTPGEDVYLRRNAGKKSRREMAEHLGRTDAAINEQLRKFDSARRNTMRSSHPWTKAEDRQLRTLSRSIRSLDVVAERMGRTRNAIAGRKAKLGLTQRRPKM